MFCPVRLNAGLKFPPRINLIFAQLLSSAFHVISCVIKKWWSKLGEATESLQKKKKKYRETLHPAGSRGASGPGLGARWPAGGRAERRQSPASSGTEGSVSPLRLCTRWVGVGSHCGQRKWLPKGAGRLPAVCRAEKSVAQIGKKRKRKKNKKAPPLLRVSSANLADYVAARTLQVSGNFACSAFAESVLWF